MKVPSQAADKAIEVRNLQRSYGDLKVLKGINFSVARGQIFALLGPNGAGKTTTIKILSTLLLPDGGKAEIDGFDVVKQDSQVRTRIGLTGQYAAVDEYLSGKENLHMMGRLYRLSVKDSERRANELLKQFDLANTGKRPVKTYSGGMKRRIDLAMSLVATPSVIFLDEPTTGLDPRSRLTMWGIIQDLAKSGTTILLTTQYMEEADRLADYIVVIDGGKVIAEGTSDNLKNKVGADRLEITLVKKGALEAAKKIIGTKGVQIDEDRGSMSVASRGGVTKLKDLLNKLEAAKIEVETVSLHRPTLDDVFLSLTGHSATTDEAAKPKKKRGKK